MLARSLQVYRKIKSANWKQTILHSINEYLNSSEIQNQNKQAKANEKIIYLRRKTQKKNT